MGTRSHATEGRTVRRTASAPTAIGMRVRELRMGAGLTQAELGGTRFTKEYVSQVELGKTKPSDAAIRWFAERLGINRSAIEGTSEASTRAACEAVLTRAEAEIEAHRYETALSALAELDESVARIQDARLQLRVEQARGWAYQNLGMMDQALQ